MSLVKFQTVPARSILDFLYPQFQATATQPAVNIIETNQGFRIELAAPGLDKSDFQVKLESGLLSISAQKEAVKEETNAQFRRREFAFQSFSRSFRLPDTVDAGSVTANFTNGILKVELTKKPEAQPVYKTIEIN